LNKLTGVSRNVGHFTEVLDCYKEIRAKLGERPTCQLVCEETAAKRQHANV